MRRLISALLVTCVVLGPVPGSAQNAYPVTFETVTFTNAATGFTASTLAPPGGQDMTFCSGKLETAQIRYRYDGTDPSTTIGAILDVGDVVEVRGLAYLKLFKGIRTGASSGVINFHCTRL